MVDEKARGVKPKVVPIKRRERSVDIAGALEASLQQAKERKRA